MPPTPPHPPHHFPHPLPPPPPTPPPPQISASVSWARNVYKRQLSQKNMTISWGYYFRTGIIMTLPVLFVTLAAL
ncbi:ArsB/NhaD family transporter, partial [Escherichia coli]|uniref:ArsB/NhaD family transporter n=1 Tax=Escherichia coli TaxID=562 RepID=UPI003D3276E0